MKQHDTHRKAPSTKAEHTAVQPAAFNPSSALFTPQGQRSTHPESIFAMQRTIGNAGVQRLLRKKTPLRQRSIQRETEEAQASFESETYEKENERRSGVAFGTNLVDTYDDGLDVIRESALSLAEYKGFFQRTSKVIPAEVEACLAQVSGLSRTFSEGAGTVSDDDMDQLVMWYGECEEAEASARTDKSFIVQGILMKKKAELLAAEAEFQKMEPALRDLQHQVFLSDQPDLLIVAGDAIAGYIGTVEGIKDTALQMETAYNNVRSWQTNKTLSFDMAELTGSGKPLFETASKIKSTYEKFKQLSDTVDLFMPQKTKQQEAMNGISAMGMISDSGIPFGDTSLPLTGYPIGPMIENAKVLMTKINSAVSKDNNHHYIKMGQYDRVIWKLELGGWTMFRFIQKSLQASSVDQIPDLSEDVTKYFLDHADNFNAALGGVADVPVQGVFISGIDPEKIKRWVFKHRKSIWGALYGSLQAPQ